MSDDDDTKAVVAHLQRIDAGVTGPSDVRFITVNKSAVKCKTQVLVSASCISTPCRMAVLTIFDGGGGRSNRLYFSYQQWLKFKTLVDDNGNACKLIRTDQLLALVLPSPLNQCGAFRRSGGDGDGDGDGDDDAEAANNTHINVRASLGASTSIRRSGFVIDDENTVVLRHVNPWWIHNQWSDTMMQRLLDTQSSVHQDSINLQRTIDYVTLFFDYVMMQTESLNETVDGSKVERDWLRYVDRRALAFGHEETGVFFIGRYIRMLALAPITNEDVVILERDPLLAHWISFQVYEFRHMGDIDVTQFSDNVTKHVAYFHTKWRQISQQWQHGDWSLWTVGGGGTQYWIAKSDDTYVVNTRWLFEQEFEELLLAPGLVSSTGSAGAGTISLSKCTFMESFLPSLYRHCVLDVVYMFVALASPTNSARDLAWTEQSRFYGPLYGDTGSPGESELRVLDALFWRHMAEMPRFTTTVYTGILQSYNEDAQAYASPITTYMPQHLDQKKRRLLTASNKNRASDVASRVAQLIDIEDLVLAPEQVMPPCVSGVLRQQWYKNKDRLNLVGLLLDMGYENKEEIVNTLCRNRDGDAFDHTTIEALVDGHKKKREKDPGYKGRCSLVCGTVINAEFESGNNIRCPYERQVNGELRRFDHSDAEKMKFRKKCGDSLEVGYRIVSPMDYVAFKTRTLLSSRCADSTTM
jgi:hypothetical protein